MMDNSSSHTEKELLAIVRGFLTEFNKERAISHLTINASIERDLGIDSLGRVELFLRIEKAFSTRFEDAVMIEAESLLDIVIAIQKAKPIDGQPQVQEKNLKTLETTLGDLKLDPLSSKTLIDILLRRVAEDPNRPHIYLQDEHGVEEIIRYGQLLEAANRVAVGLLEQGLKTFETVAIMLPTCPEFFYAFFGVLLAGGIPVPIYPPLRADKIEEYALREATILNNAEVRILITFDKVETLSKLLRVFIKSLNLVTTIPLLLQAHGLPPALKLQPHDPALIQYTSGSTSAPKGVLLNHFNLLSNIRAYGNAIQISPQDVGISWLPLYHDMGLIGAWLGSLYHAFPLILLSPLSFLNRPERWLWAIHYHRGTISAGPNFAYELCVRKVDDSLIQGLDLSSWRLALNGAEAVNPKTLERFQKKFSPYGFKEDAFYPVYGLAESTVALTFPPLNRVPRVDIVLRDPFLKEQRAVIAPPHHSESLSFVSCGKPLAEHDIRIVNENGEEMADRKVGSLQFTGPSAMQGYYRNIEASQAIFHDGWWDSGDFAYTVEGEVYITGRKKDIIIKAGRNFYPQEIEEVTAEINGIRKGCVIAFGINDPKWGTERLIIVAESFETQKEKQNQMVSDIVEKVSVVLAIPPDEIILVPPRTLPKTSSGKLQRSLCKEAYLQGKLTKKGLPVGLQIAKLFIKGLWIKLGLALKKCLQFIYSLYIGILLVFFIPCILFLTFFPRQLALKSCKMLATMLLTLSGSTIQVTDKENLSKFSPMIFIANHASYIDSLVLLTILPFDVAFVGKKEIKNWPLIGRLIQKLGYLTIDRMDFTKSLADTANIIQSLKEKRSVIIYPEGTFTYSPGLRPFKLGAFKIAVDTASPLCPIALNGTRQILQKGVFQLNRPKIQITIGEPLSPLGQEWNEVSRLHSLARREIEKHCGELTLDLLSASFKASIVPNATQ